MLSPHPTPPHSSLWISWILCIDPFGTLWAQPYQIKKIILTLSISYGHGAKAVSLSEDILVLAKKPEANLEVPFQNL